MVNFTLLGYSNAKNINEVPVIRILNIINLIFSCKINKNFKRVTYY